MNRRGSSFLILALLLCLGLSARPASRTQTTAPPAQQTATAARFAFGGNAAEIPAEFIGNLVFLPVRVNQSQPSLFLLDSTADTSSIDPGRARELGLSPEQEPVLNLNGVDVPLASLPTNARKDFGLEVGRAYEGTLGRDFFERVVVEIDYARRTVRLYDPAVYKYSGQGAVFPLIFSGSAPVVQAKFSVPKGKDLKADFLVNTALDASTVVFDRYAEAHHIFSGHFKTIPDVNHPPDSGEPAVIGRLKEFQLDRYTVEDSLATFTQRAMPQSSGAGVAGEIGGGMLRRFTVVLDYPHKKIMLESNIHLAEEDEEDKSGISVVAKGDRLKTFEIVQVQPGTPAAEAGIQKGDVIAGVDTDAAADLTLAEIRELFRQVGHKYNLLIQRNGQTQQIAIQTRRLL
ncbi:MAG TPA: PDZ domain-containing protein [Candidatus Acidoferrales bacterium]|nr:PDZ domain-containing protein [Candidatus Acidoferrales bacterium]